MTRRDTERAERVRWGFGYTAGHRRLVRGAPHPFVKAPHGPFTWCAHAYYGPDGDYAWTCNKPRMDHDE